MRRENFGSGRQPSSRFTRRSISRTSAAAAASVTLPRQLASKLSESGVEKVKTAGVNAKPCRLPLGDSRSPNAVELESNL